MLAIQEQLRTLAERSSSLLSAYNEQMLKVMEPPSYLLAMQEQLQTVAERTASFRSALFVAGLAGRFPTATVLNHYLRNAWSILRVPKANLMLCSERLSQSMLLQRLMRSLLYHQYQGRSLNFLIV
jgi:hypothetical protein